MDTPVKDLPPELAAVGAVAGARLEKTIAGLVETGGQGLNPATVAAAVAKEMQSMLTATGAAMTGVSAPVGAAFAPTGRFLSGAVDRMDKPDASALGPLDIAQRLLNRQKNIDLGNIGVTPPAAPTIRSDASPVGENF
jgi:hypothetical protein